MAGTVEEFLGVYNPQRSSALWQQLRGTPQLDLFRSPFYLRLLLAQAGDGGPALQGRAGLFTGFVRQAVQREIEADNPLFRPGALLDKRDHERLVQHAWRNATDLPARGALLPALCQLAYGLQARRAPGEASRVRVPYDDALALLDGEKYAPLGDELLHAGVALQVLEVQWDDVLYVHQLLQEYFAARALTGQPRPELVSTAWRADQISPSLPDVLVGLADSDPLPAAPATGWEETFVLAAAMARSPEDFVSALLAVNLPLAGRCAAQPDVVLSDALRRRLQQALIERSRDPAADLRARIAATRALGELGDPRFERRRGPLGEYLLPPLVALEAGTYPIGSDEGIYPEEAPAHGVEVAAVHLARFPVTNAEWRLFIAAGGYDDERWWETAAARRWRSGEGTADGIKQRGRDNLQWIRDNPEEYRRMVDDGRVNPLAAANYEKYLAMSEAEFESLLDEKIPSGRQTEPRWWNDPAYNEPTQPVVGICWHEARAYCAWLSAQSGLLWRLPSEAEWEAAARGLTGRRYAWGDDFDPARGNTFESHIRGTTPVGVFPGGDTPEGVADLSGNVWEWTSSAPEPYPYVPNSGREDPAVDAVPRVLRGGSWDYGRDLARCAYRYHSPPGDRYGLVGFRVWGCLPHPEALTTESLISVNTGSLPL
ncbi:SUMF1/EgtB/PvdO family nonheme iron enzyme [Candidatus Accumulibacter vicinus]|uniref:Serine/threonine-protein kinase pkn1 n=1 Tax=Candidatus Accumulibacter vicinus TaxID=2954382 RepID=A0A084Y2L3_9PROT|nr:SUMF1/EgtB/PvdO family nonheme iron enzyme [Candidatus Accumulibacter vicinus]KFB68957.1 MAG: Serine/threonine-protein kinase pkn1 [Candidatus Accumulibacter vicinus]